MKEYKNENKVELKGDSISINRDEPIPYIGVSGDRAMSQQSEMLESIRELKFEEKERGITISNVKQDLRIVNDSHIGTIGGFNGLGKQAAFYASLEKLSKSDKNNVVVVGDYVSSGKTTCTADEYLAWNKRQTFDRSVPHLGSSAGMSHHLYSYKLTNTYEKLDDWDNDEGLKYGPMGGETKSSKRGFENRIKKNRKRRKNKKTHRK